MISSFLNLLLFSILVISLQLQVSSDNIVPTDAGDQRVLVNQHHFQQQQQQQPQQRHHHHQPLSCYVCSTMDYENTSDNLCRVMKHHHRTPAGLHPPSNIGHHPVSMMNYPTTTLASTTDASTGFTTEPMDQSTLHSSMNDAQASLTHHDELSSDSFRYQNNLSSTEYGDSQFVNSNRTTTTTIAPQPTTSHHGYYPQNQNRMPPANYIRTRQCLDDENFCSIVSVVRIEFVNDNVLPKFWAMERNCSKSCNTGCMLIGERVRLRVCSQCCKGNNCNIGSGSPPMSFLNLYQLIIIALIIIKVSKYAI